MIRHVLRVVVLTIAPHIALADLRAQPTARDHASAFLPPDHWAAMAARRAAVLGHGPAWLGFAEGSITRREAALVLRAAAESEEHVSPAHAHSAHAQWERFTEEFSATVAVVEVEHGRTRLFGEGSLVTGYDVRSTEFVPGFAEWIQFGGSGPLPVESTTSPRFGATWSVPLVSTIALVLSPRRVMGDWNASEGYGVFRYRAASLWLGRRSLAYGPGESGGLILNPATPFTGGGILVGPTTLPAVLRFFGPIRFEGFLSRIDSSFAVKDPWIMVNHGSISPHPRLLLGLTHGAIFAGSGRPPFTPRNFFAMVLLGRAIKGSAEAEFENQLVAGEIRWRPPVASLPLELHVAWGTEDNQGAWYEVPASQFGARIAALPHLPEIAFGLERTEFEPPCAECGNQGFNSNWYRHYIYKAGWTVDQQLLGHPLGGNGVEWLAWTHADLHDAKLRLDARAYYRERGPYNLFAPELQGYGYGGRLGAAWRFDRGLEALGTLELERLGNNDLRSVGFVGLKAIF